MVDMWKPQKRRWCLEMRKKPKQNSNECSQSASSISHPRPGYLLTRSKRSKTSYLFLARRLIRLFHRRTYVSFQTCGCIYVCVFVWVAQLYPTLCDPIDHSPPGSSVHRILQARMLEWVAMSSSRGSSWPRDQTQVSCIAGRFFTIWAIEPG